MDNNMRNLLAVAALIAVLVGGYLVYRKWWKCEACETPVAEQTTTSEVKHQEATKEEVAKTKK
jgi:hypothetical protein